MPAEQVVETVNENEFDDAFKDAVADAPQPVDAETVPDETPPQQGEVVETEEKATDAAVAESASETQDDPTAELAQLRAELEALKTPKPAAEEAAPQVQPEPDPIYTPEQTAQLTEFRKEWPEVVAGMDLMLAGFAKQMQQQIFSQLTPALAPLMEQYQVSAEEMQYNAIKAAHADYDAIYDDVLKWVDKQPAYIKNALEHVVAEGSAADVADMISRYKLEAGVKAVTPTPAPKVTDLPEAAKKVARSLGVVSSKRSAVPQSQDPTDFDGAWSEAVNG